jgi:hypothetical protein
MPKMVMNNFGNRNFMQPMVRFNIHSNCFDFFLSSFDRDGGGGCFFFSLYSQHVPFKFPIGSNKVPNMFPKGVPYNTSL